MSVGDGEEAGVDININAELGLDIDMEEVMSRWALAEIRKLCHIHIILIPALTPPLTPV